MPATRRLKRHASRTRKSGGKYLASGAFGCVFRPAIKCKGEDSRRNGMLSKLMNRDAAEEELGYGKIFKVIDADKDFFIFPEAICEPDKTPSVEDNFDECELVNITNPYIDARLLLVEDGGVSLSKFMPEAGDYYAFFQSLTNLFTGMAVAHSRGVIHMDVKPANIVTKKDDSGNFVTRFIDFGLTQETYNFNAPLELYPYYPFDIKFAHKNYINGSKEPSDEDAVDFYKEQKFNSPLFPDWMLIRKGGGRLNAAYANAIIKGIKTGTITKDQYAKGCDVFGLGRSLAELYARLTGHIMVQDKRSYLGYVVARRGKIMTSKSIIGESAEVQKYHAELASRVSSPFYNMIMAMTHINPQRRISVSEAGARYKRLLPAMQRIFSRLPELKSVYLLQDAKTPAKPS